MNRNKNIIIICVVALILVIAYSVRKSQYDKIVGVIKDSEGTTIQVNDVTYEMIYYRGKEKRPEKGKYYGAIADFNGDIVYRAYRVKGEEKLEHLYVLFGFERMFYVRKDSLVDDQSAVVH